MSELSFVVRCILLLAAVLFSVVVSLVTFMLKRSTGAGVPDGILVAGSAFAGCMVLCLGVLTAAVGI